MNVLKKILLCLTLVTLVQSVCYKQNVNSVEECEDQESLLNSSYYCCFVEFRTNKNKDYKKVCVDVRPEDIKDGHHEVTIPAIEGGNYTASGWTPDMLENFKEFSSIRTFDCKSSHLLITKMFLFIIINVALII